MDVRAHAGMQAFSFSFSQVSVSFTFFGPFCFFFWSTHYFSEITDVCN